MYMYHRNTIVINKMMTNKSLSYSTRESNGPGSVKEKLTDWTSEGQLNVAERLQNHADWLRNFRREMGLQSPSQSSRGNMASSAR